MLGAAEGLFEACIAAIPYAPATAFLANEQEKLAAIPYSAPRKPGQRAGARRRDDGERPRVAILADGIGSTHGVTRTIEEIRDRGVPGFEIEVVGTDPKVDRRLSAVAEIDVPFYPGLRIGVPSLPVAVQTLAGLGGGGYDVIHVCSPGPAGICGALVARALGLPLVGSYHTELAAYAGLRSGDQRVADAMASPSAPSTTRATSCSPRAPPPMARSRRSGCRPSGCCAGIAASTRRASTRRCAIESLLPGAINVLYAGRITREKGAELLADAFLLAREREPRLHLVLAGGGPEEEHVRGRLGEHASFLGWLQGDELARAYASADMFVFPSATDTFGQVILEAQASGVPTVALARGGPLSLIENGISGLLCEPDARVIAGALLELAASPLLREQLDAGRARCRQAAHVGANARASCGAAIDTCCTADELPELARAA